MSELETIAARLEKREKQNRRWKLLACAAVLIACIPVVLGAAKPSGTIQAGRFEVVDSNGNVRAVLGIGSEDRAYLEIASRHRGGVYAWASEKDSGINLKQNARGLPDNMVPPCSVGLWCKDSEGGSLTIMNTAKDFDFPPKR